MPDALTEVFSLLDLRSARCTRLEAGGDWALRFPAKPALKFGAVLKGGCWMMQPGLGPQRLSADDVFLLANTPAYVIASDPSLPARDGLALGWDRSYTVTYNGSDTVLLAGSFALDRLHERLLLDALPPFMRIAASANTASALRHTLEILDAEIRSREMGQDTVMRHLADILLVQMLRAHAGLNAGGAEGASWIAALADRRVGTALDLMHADPAYRWTVDELARSAGMSRSAFSLAFKSVVGKPPLDYLLHWRMQVAARLLARGRRVAEVARTVGYASESAFGNAFRRIQGHSPKKAAASNRAERNRSDATRSSRSRAPRATRPTSAATSP